MPVRFTSPGLGGQRQSVLASGQWQIGASYRHLGADQWFVGTEVNEAAAPGGRRLYLDINSLDLSVSYGLSQRVSLALTLPFSYGTHSRFYADSARHKVSGLGLGDITLIGSTWLRDPGGPQRGNASLGLGLKLPTGSNEVTDDFFDGHGAVSQQPVDQSIQPGDGGWGILLQLQAFHQVGGRAQAYVLGSYLLSPRKTTHVLGPGGVPLSVPDVYSARAGLAYAVWPSLGMSVSVGARIDGIPLRDVIGGGDLGFRRPGFIFYLDPGIALGRGPDEFSVSVPVRLRQDFRLSLFDRANGKAGGGDLADLLVFAGYTHRF